jgi:hypothetical protein
LEARRSEWVIGYIEPISQKRGKELKSGKKRDTIEPGGVRPVEVTICDLRESDSPLNQGESGILRSQFVISKIRYPRGRALTS